MNIYEWRAIGRSLLTLISLFILWMMKRKSDYNESFIWKTKIRRYTLKSERSSSGKFIKSKENLNLRKAGLLSLKRTWKTKKRVRISSNLFSCSFSVSNPIISMFTDIHSIRFICPVRTFSSQFNEQKLALCSSSYFQILFSIISYNFISNGQKNVMKNVKKRVSLCEKTLFFVKMKLICFSIHLAKRLVEEYWMFYLYLLVYNVSFTTV